MIKNMKCYDRESCWPDCGQWKSEADMCWQQWSLVTTRPEIESRVVISCSTWLESVSPDLDQTSLAASTALVWPCDRKWNPVSSYPTVPDWNPFSPILQPCDQKWNPEASHPLQYRIGIRSATTYSSLHARTMLCYDVIITKHTVIHPFGNWWRTDKRNILQVLL